MPMTGSDLSVHMHLPMTATGKDSDLSVHAPSNGGPREGFVATVMAVLLFDSQIDSTFAENSMHMSTDASMVKVRGPKRPHPSHTHTRH